MSILLWPFEFVASLIGTGVSVAAWLAPLWALGSIALLRSSAYRRTGRSKWGWLVAAVIGVWNPLVGIPVAVAHALGPRRPVKAEHDHMAALGT